MTQYPILLNKEATSFFGANLNKDSVTAVPSYLMNTPSRDFSVEHDRTKTAGILGLDIAVDLVDSKLLNILALEGYFQSEIGKHYLKLRQTAILDMTLEADGAYYISADIAYTEGQYTNLSFYLDVTANPIVGQKLAEISLAGGVITLVSVEPAKAIHELDTRFASVVEAIANLASSQGEITSTASQAITITPAIMPFTIKTDSTNPEVFAFDDTNDLITFLLNANYNFLSTVSIKSSTNFVATITFRLVNDADDAVILTQQMIADIPTGNTEIFPLNTLLAVGNGVIPDAPLSIRLEVVSDIVGMEIVYFNSILSAGSYVDTYSKLQIDTGIANRRKQYAKETLPRDVVVGDVTAGKATIILTADENLYGRIVISDTTPLTSVAGELLISSDIRDLIVVNNDNADYKVWRDNGAGAGVGGFITVLAGETQELYCDGTNVSIIATTGMIINKKRFSTGTYASGTLTIPADDTIPTITEGTQFMTTTYQPIQIGDKLHIDVNFQGGFSANAPMIIALNDGTDTIAATATYSNTNYLSIAFSYEMVIANLNPITFNVRAGGASAGTTYFNGFSGAKFGGVHESSISITEHSK